MVSRFNISVLPIVLLIQGIFPGRIQADEWTEPVRFETLGVQEPSGLCFHPGRNTLFVAGDRGRIEELDPAGRSLNHRDLGEHDFEGVTCDPSTGRLYVAVEGEEAILEVDPETLSSLRRFQLPREFEGRLVMKEGGQGIEGITFRPDPDHAQGGTFFVSNQCNKPEKHPEDISAIFEVELPLRTSGNVRILRQISMTEIDLAGLHYAGDGSLWVISDKSDVLIRLDSAGNVVSRKPLPGQDQEGITQDAEGNLYIAQDSGGVLKIQ